jgi:hypothetical protein
MTETFVLFCGVSLSLISLSVFLLSFPFFTHLYFFNFIVCLSVFLLSFTFSLVYTFFNFFVCLSSLFPIFLSFLLSLNSLSVFLPFFSFFHSLILSLILLSVCLSSFFYIFTRLYFI